MGGRAVTSEELLTHVGTGDLRGRIRRLEVAFLPLIHMSPRGTDGWCVYCHSSVGHSETCVWEAAKKVLLDEQVG